MIKLDNAPETNAETDSKSDKLMDFVAIMVHDLQGPFVSMKTILKLLQQGRFDTSNKVHLDLLNSSVIAFQRSESIIHDLIDAAKAGAIGFPVELDFHDIGKVVANSIDMLKACALEYGVNLKIEHKQDVKAQLDKDLFLRVLDNLVFNAIKHTTRGGNITVQTGIAEDSVLISVKDEGPGFGDINPGDLFEKYKQLDLRTKGKYKGVGLGLYFCRLAVEAMDGKIWAENDTDGGARFNVSLIKDRRRG